MFLIVLRIILILVITYLVLLLWTWIISLLPYPDHGGGNSGGNEQVPIISPDPDDTSKHKPRQKRWLEVDESYSKTK